jgi:hypothetical protein
MKNNYRFTLSTLAFAALMLSGMFSCVNNDEHCVDPRGNVCLKVKLNSEIDIAYPGEGKYRIEAADVYVFDSEGRYVTSVEGTEADGEYEYWLSLSSGKYNFVSWINRGDVYRINPETLTETRSGDLTMDDFELYLDHGGKTLTSTLPELMHGISRGMNISGEADNPVEMEITPLTYTVNLKAKNLPASNQNYAFTIIDNNSHYDFNGELIEGMDNFRHTRTGKAPEGEFNASIRTLALRAGRHPQFVFSNTTTGETLHEADLIYTITRALAAAGPTADFNKIYTYDIELTFNAAKMDFTVTVNGWEYDESEQIFG